MKIYKIKLFFNKTDCPVSFDYYDNIKSFIYTTILSNNDKYHGKMSLYSVSPLFNESSSNKKFLEYKRGAIMYITTPSTEVFKDFYLYSKNAIGKSIGFGLFLSDVSFSMKDYNETSSEVYTSPIYLGEYAKNDDITYKHEVAEDTAKHIFLSKTRALGYNYFEKDFSINFIKENAKTKRILLNKHSLIASKCKVSINSTNSDIISLFYGLGIGKSTGCGFGFINVK